MSGALAAMRSGVTGLQTQAVKLGVSADNIANSGTVGYKRGSVEFSTLVTEQSGSNSYNPGGVKPVVRSSVNVQGLLQASSSSTDLAINGRGFYMVADAVNPDPQQDTFMLTRAGSFVPDANGNLVNASGAFLQGWPLNADGTTVSPNPARDSFQDLETVNITGINFTGAATTTITFAGNLPAQNTKAGSTADPVQTTMEYYNPVGETKKLTLEWTPTVPAAATDPSSNEWTLKIIDSATAEIGADGVVGEYTIKFNGLPPGAGSIESIAPTTGSYDAVTGKLTVATPGGNMDIEVGVPGKFGGVTQFAGDYVPTQVSKDGAQFGALSRVETDEKGIMSAVFNNGVRRPIYQLPIADVTNPDGLIKTDGNNFIVGQDSGALYLWDSGKGPTGHAVGYSLEASNVDIATELTDLIATQRAYSANSKVVTTADAILEETTNLKR